MSNVTLSPHELRNAMRSTLKAALEQMDSDAFHDAWEELSAEEQKAADVTRVELYRTWRRLNNQQLDEIREQLIANEADLRRATGELAAARLEVLKVTAYLETANQFLNVASRLIAVV
jgi:hypothetical protein